MPKKNARVKIPAAESPLEAALFLSIRAAGLPLPTRQFMFAKSIGRKWLWDFSWNDIKLAVEVQGGIHMRRSGHNTAAGILRDCEKSNEAILQGWTVLHVAKEHIDDGQALIWIVRALQQLTKN